MTHLWMKNMILCSRPSPEVITALFELCTSQYADVRMFSQDLLAKVLRR